MTNRVLDIAQEDIRLRIRNSCLEILSGNDALLVSIAIADIESLILSNPRIILSHAVLGELTGVGICIVTCDRNHRPVGMMLPLAANQNQRQRFEAQAAMGTPQRKRLWQSIVQAKIRAQAANLEEFESRSSGLREMAPRVRSGDPDNLEAQAARRYWPLLFPEPRFRRGDDEDNRNHCLDYGYAVLRASVARALCGCGLHPAFELHHHGPYNTFPLADDLMEPFRPAVDRVVRLESERRQSLGMPLQLDPDSKRTLIGALTARYRVEGELRTLQDIVQRTCQQLAAAILDKDRTFSIPELRAEVRKDVASAVQNHVDDRALRSAS